MRAKIIGEFPHRKFLVKPGVYAPRGVRPTNRGRPFQDIRPEHIAELNGGQWFTAKLYYLRLVHAFLDQPVTASKRPRRINCGQQDQAQKNFRKRSWHVIDKVEMLQDLFIIQIARVVTCTVPLAPSYRLCIVA